MAFAGFRARCGSGCGCANGCAIGTGDFSDGVTTGWTTSGTWAETGGLFVGTGAGIATFDTVVPLATDAVMVVTQPRKLSSDGTLRLAIAKYSNAYLFGELAIASGAGTLRLASFDGSTVSYLSDAIVLNDVGTELDARSQLCVSWKPRGEREVGASTSTGELEATTVDDESSNWANENNALADDGANATFTFPSSAGTEDSGVLSFSWPGEFNIPTGSLITGIAVEIQATGGGGLFTVVDLRAQLISGVDAFDDKALGTAIGTEEVRTYGGVSDDWGGMTAEHVNAPTFAFKLQFQRTTPFPGGTVTLDYAGKIIVHYTTPTGYSGTLRASYRNTGDDQAYQCVTNYDVSWDAPDESKSGLVIDSGNWDFSTYSLEYMESAGHPSCGQCECNFPPSQFSCSCCDAEFPPASSYVIDLGAGGWTDGLCGFCDTVAGEYLLTAAGPCFWDYREAIDCPADGTGGRTYPHAMIMTLMVFNDGRGCKWRLSMYGPAISDPTDPVTTFSVLYESDYIITGANCQASATLTKTSANNALCGGDLPATATVSIP